MRNGAGRKAIDEARESKRKAILKDRKRDRKAAEDTITNYLRDRQINQEIVELNKQLGR